MLCVVVIAAARRASVCHLALILGGFERHSVTFFD